MNTFIKCLSLICAMIVWNIRAAEDLKAFATATDGAGAPVADARIEVCGQEAKLPDGKWDGNRTPHCVMPHASLSNGRAATGDTDKDGRFSVNFYNQDRRANVWVLKEGFAPAFATLTLGADPVKIVLGKGEQLAGVVKTKAGEKLEPVKGASVHLMCVSGDLEYVKKAFDDPYFFTPRSGGDLPLIQHAKTDDSGKYSFRISEPPAGKKWYVVLSNRNLGGLSVEQITAVDFKAGQAVQVPDFIVESAAKK